jgi:hypothetical protein
MVNYIKNLPRPLFAKEGENREAEIFIIDLLDNTKREIIVKS